MIPGGGTTTYVFIASRVMVQQVLCSKPTVTLEASSNGFCLFKGRINDQGAEKVKAMRMSEAEGIRGCDAENVRGCPLCRAGVPRNTRAYDLLTVVGGAAT